MNFDANNNNFTLV